VSSLQCVLHGVRAVIERKACHPFCCLRPPGHHVGRDGRTHDAESQGFCFFNNVAIAAKYAVDRLGLQRVAVMYAELLAQPII
jgi:acetoin utilization deacetylase AcuC-like enzyme